MKLTLIRHGETEGSRRDLYYGAADIPVLPESLKALEEKAKTGVYPTAGHYCISGMLSPWGQTLCSASSHHARKAGSFSRSPV